MQATHEITAQQVCDLFITAVEGGSAYWCRVMTFSAHGTHEVSYQSVETFEGDTWRVMVLPSENPDDRKYYEITPTSLAAALSALPTRTAALIDGTYDAEDADCIIQHAAFGDIVFG